MAVKNELSVVLGPGTHASTFGGNPLACAASIAVFDTIRKQKLLKHASEAGAYLRKKLIALADEHPCIKEVRGLGLMLGVELDRDGSDIARACMEKGLLINCTNVKVIRWMPALIVKKDEIDRAVSRSQGFFVSIFEVGFPGIAYLY